MLYATILTKTYDPHCKLNGDDLNVSIGILHAVLAIIVELAPLQLVKSKV